MAIPFVQRMVNLVQSDLLVTNGVGSVGRKIGRRGVLYEFWMERTADAHGGEPVSEDKPRQRRLVANKTMGAKTWNNIHQRRTAWLQPEGER